MSRRHVPRCAFLLASAIPAYAQCETGVLLASDGGPEAHFGRTLDLRESTVVVEAPDHWGTFGAQGAAYVFVRSGPAWIESARLLASDADHQDGFGDAVALDGGRIAVGAPDANPFGDNSGKAYVFEQVSGAWSEVADLAPSDGDLNDRFGYSVALDHDVLAVGAVRAGIGFDSDGAVYVFRRTGGVWIEEAKVEGADEANDFGGSLALEGDRLLVGAPRQGTAGSGAGTAYVFERVAGAWSLTATLQPALVAAEDRFGTDVELARDRAFVSAPYADLAGVDAGAIYVFDAATWSLLEIVVPDDAQTSHRLGLAFDVDRDRLVASAQGGLDPSPSVYVFDLAATPIQRVGKLALDHVTEVTLEQGSLLVGDPDDDTSASSAGAVRDYVLTGSAVSFGTGTKSVFGTGPIALSGGGCLAPGGTLRAEVLLGQPGVAGLLIAGAQAAAAPYGAGHLYVAPPFVLQHPHVLGGTPGMLGTGKPTLLIPLPANPSLVGIEVRLQAGYLDPLTPFGVALSNGVHVQIGST